MEFNTETLKQIVSIQALENEKLRTELAAAQAQNAHLREALKLWAVAVDNAEECEFDDMAAYCIPMPLFCDADEATEQALATNYPDDALKEYGARLVKAVLDEFELKHGLYNSDEIADKIRKGDF